MDLTDNVAWLDTVGRLDVVCAYQLAAPPNRSAGSQRSSRKSNLNRSASIVLLDRISPRTATVSWSDPQGCKYGEQVWRLAAAKRPGTCALTGRPVAKGDAIYRPTTAEPPPANADAMMLAEALNEAFSNY
jgi:hypothetical protein